MSNPAKLNNEASVAMAIPATWSAIHGLAMLIVDGRSDEARSPGVLVEGKMQRFLNGRRSYVARVAQNWG